MLAALHLGNFKAFAETQRVPIRPLTLIFGANSSGKSSLIHGLLLAKEAVEGKEATLDVYRTDAGGDSVDLGGFRQYVHRREAGRRVEWAAEIDAARFQGRLAELLAPVKRVTVSVTIGIELDDEGHPVPDAHPAVDSYELEADGASLLRMSRRRDGTLRLDRLGHDHPVFREVLKAIVETATTAESLSPTDFEELSEVIAALVPEITAHAERLLPRGILHSETLSPEAGQMALFPVSRGRRKEDLTEAVRFFLPRTLDALIKGLSEAVAGELSRLRYLGPLRSYPPRHLAFAQYHDPNWFAGGGYAWDVVRRDEKVRTAVNAWLGSEDRLQTPYELRVNKLTAVEDLKLLLSYFLEEEYSRAEKDHVEGREPYPDSYLGVLDPNVTTEGFLKFLSGAGFDQIRDLVLFDRRTQTVVSHRDVGIGISQVLPVLVGAYASHNRLLAIEQPEIHLHPALQAELGDVFIQSALGNQQNTCILETHSEHLILRILRRIRETTDGELEPGLTPIRPEQVAVLYVLPGKDGAKVVEIPIRPDGEFAERWPQGFFAERAKELF